MRPLKEQSSQKPGGSIVQSHDALNRKSAEVLPRIYVEYAQYEFPGGVFDTPYYYNPNQTTQHDIPRTDNIMNRFQKNTAAIYKQHPQAGISFKGQIAVNQ